MLGCLRIRVLHVVHDAYLGVVCYSNKVCGRTEGGRHERSAEREQQSQDEEPALDGGAVGRHEHYGS